MKLIEKLRIKKMKKQANNTPIKYNKKITEEIESIMAWDKKQDYLNPTFKVVEFDDFVKTSSEIQFEDENNKEVEISPVDIPNLTEENKIKKESIMGSPDYNGEPVKLTPEDREFIADVAGDDAVAKLEEEYKKYKQENEFINE